MMLDLLDAILVGTVPVAFSAGIALIRRAHVRSRKAAKAAEKAGKVGHSCKSVEAGPYRTGEAAPAPAAGGGTLDGVEFAERAIHEALMGASQKLTSGEMTPHEYWVYLDNLEGAAKKVGVLRKIMTKGS